MTRSKGQDEVDRDNLTITGAHEGRDSRVSIIPGASADDALIVITECYGPGGDNLVGISEVKFSGYPAVTIGVRAGGEEGLTHLSPIHGDKRKRGFTDITPGTKVELFCPVCKRPLERVGEVDDGSGAEYFALYLSNKLSGSAMVMISDVWDHFHSRIVDDEEVISYWAATHAED